MAKARRTRGEPRRDDRRSVEDDIEDRFERIRSSLNDIDVGATYRELVAILDEVIDPTDERQLREALSGAARAAHRAFGLYLLARKEREAVRLEAERVWARWDKEALEFWEAEKEAGKITKAITKDMIRKHTLSAREDAVNELAAKVEDARNVRDELQQKHRTLAGRMYSLRTLVGGRSEHESSWRSASHEAGRGLSDD